MNRTTALRFGRHIDYAILLSVMIAVGTVAIGGYRMARFLIERVT
ncbi:unnamed protein product [marine sediment metagenome]|uniref:Uncharacterized protein n=1 Tax=marine sediment metagenome TaxID=412755 RepID=X1VSE8_9ZZZZ